LCHRLKHFAPSIERDLGIKPMDHGRGGFLIYRQTRNLRAVQLLPDVGEGCEQKNSNYDFCQAGIT
jgi:hypothetical protein